MLILEKHYSRFPKRPDGPHAALWMEEMQPMLAAWLVRGFSHEHSSCRHAACLAAANLAPYLGVQADAVRRRARICIDGLISSMAVDDHESRMNALLAKGWLK